jgi:DNA-binding phage protein
VREKEYLNTEKMIADIMTKALPKVKHYFCMNALGIILVCGGVLMHASFV